MNVEKLNRTVKHITDLLAQKKYQEMTEFDSGKRLSPIEINNTVAEYGMDICPLPKDAYSKIEVYEVEDSLPAKWAIDVPIFTREEGLSDLTLQLTLSDSDAEYYCVEIDDIHVL